MKIRAIINGFGFAFASLSLSGCDSGTGPATTGSLTVVTSTTGQNLDADGYRCRLDDGEADPMGVNEIVTLRGLAVGPHTIALSDIASNCEVAGHNPRNVTVVPFAVLSVRFDVECTALSSAT